MVYLITDGTYTKIGKADGGLEGVNKRLQSLQTGNPKNLSLKKAFKGSYELESLLHKSLSNYRINGEWFKFDFDIDDEMIECFSFLNKNNKKPKRSKSESNIARGNETDDKIDKAISKLIKTNRYISINSISDIVGRSKRTITARLKCKQKELIKKHNIKSIGSPNLNESINKKNIFSINNAISYLKSNNKKVTNVNIAKETGIHRNTVSRLIKNHNLNN